MDKLFLYVCIIIFTLTLTAVGIAGVYIVNDKPFYIQCDNGESTLWYCVDGEPWPM